MFSFEQLLVMTPATIALFVLVIAVVLFYLVANGRSMSDTARIQARLLQIARQQTMQDVTIVITLRQNVASIKPLLEYLATHRYTRVSIAVRVYAAAGKNAHRQLQNLRRQLGLQGRMTITRYCKGQTDAAFARRAVTGDLIMLLQSDERLSKGFFRYLSYALVDQTTKALAIRTYRRPQHTLLSAFRSIDAQLASGLRDVLPSRSPQTSGIQSGVAVRTSVITGSESYSPKHRLTDRFGIDQTLSDLPTVPALVSIIRAVVLIGLLSVLGSILLAMSAASASFFAGLFGLVLFLGVAFMLTSTRGLRPTDVLSMVLLLPFYPLYLVGDAIVALAKIVSRLVVKGWRRVRPLLPPMPQSGTR